MNTKYYRTTPGILKVALIATWIGAALLFLMTFVSVSEHRAALTIVGKQAVPNIVTAQRIRAGLADMDAQAANELIGKPGENMKAVKSYETKRTEVLHALVRASENVRFGDKEREQIRILTEGVDAYNAWVTLARSFHESGDAASLAAYRRATRLMHEKLLPAADALDSVNSTAVETTYKSEQSKSLVALLGLVATGTGVLGVLAFAQIFLRKRTRRSFNPALLAATAVAAVFLAYAGSMLWHSSHSLSVAKERHLGSIETLWRARALASDVKGQQSSWLFDQPLAATYARAFSEKSDQLLKVQEGKQSFAQYLEVDRKIRELETAGRHDAAVALSIGTDPGEANHAFARYDAELGKVLDANQKGFDDAINAGLSDLRFFNIIAPAVALLIALLVMLGLRPRIGEYNV